MIFQNDDDLYHARRFPWGTVLVVCVSLLLALAVVFGIRNSILKRTADGGESQADAGQTAETTSVESWMSPAVPGGTGAADPAPSTPTGTATAPVDATPVDAPPRSNIPQSGETVAERDALLVQLANATPDRRPEIEARLGAINVALATTLAPMPGKVEHTVKSGDSLSKLANQYVCPISLIRTINGLRNDNIQIGQKLWILDHPKFAIDVDKTRNTLVLSLNGAFFKRYAIGTGAEGKTPVGRFKIVEKEEKPTWYPAGRNPVPYGEPGNILGTRWMRIKAADASTPPVSGYGIHGTWDDASIGTASSAGCIRMHNADVEEIFDMVPRQTPVTIHE